MGQQKDGGHAWADFDKDGLMDVLVLENNNGANAKSFLMRQFPAGTFTNVQSTLAPGMLGDWAERQAVWGDLNNDGRPDFMINSSGNGPRVAMQIFIQNTDGTFGNGIGGTAPMTVGRNSGDTYTINPINSEGAGFIDFEGDGDLDIFFDSHNYGIEILRNNYIDHTTNTVVNPAPNAMFTHITNLNGSPNVQFGLNQFATDGDYGSAADVNDDGWVDIFMRKRDENDFFLNQGGVFTNGADLAQADNGNKGANGLWDLDNDGDLDAVWTENGLSQIFRNDGLGIWTPLGAATFPGLPQPTNIDNGNSSARIDALAGGDIDNDGDIDILFVGNSRSYLFINQLNSPTPAPGVIGSGAAMSFSLDPQTFNSGRDGEGTTMVDIDDDGDLDIYMNINNNANQLYINNLPAANRNNHLIINVTEDRGPDGTTGGFPGRVALGTNVLIRDCTGNIISGLRQVNGVYGHGTQQPEQVHFGLPLGENETYIIEVRYPNFVHPVNGVTRLIATTIAQPSTIPGTNHYSMTTTDAEIIENPNAPIANDDLVTVPYGNTVSVQINLFANDTEPDGENFFIESIVQPTTGLVTIDDADNGIITYTYNAGSAFPGTTFQYTITDATSNLCLAQGKSDTAIVTIYEPCSDPSGLDSDGDGINDVCDYDDDNDGISDIDEQLCSGNNPGVLISPMVIEGGTRVDALYTDYNGLWYSSTASLNPIKPNLSHNLLAFESNGTLYTTGVINNNLHDTDADGRFDQVDTDNNGIGDTMATGLEWEAFRPSSVMTNKVTIEASLNDGNLSGANGLTIISNPATDPLNPLLTYGAHGLDLGTGIANINATLYYDISNLSLGAVGDGVPDIMLTQIAQTSPLVTHTIAFFDAAGNPVGNAVRVSTTGELASIIGTQKSDVYQIGGGSWQINVDKEIRMATVELAEFGINATNIDDVVLMTFTLNANADTAFIAYNKDSFGDICQDLDTDFDGIPDRIDLDSDNDGIFDVVEAGHNFTPLNGVLIGAVGSDGIIDVLQTNPNNQTTVYTILDTDAEGIYNFQDSDSDADGCVDANESYGASDIDSDNNGMYGTGFPAVNSFGLVTAASYTNPLDADANGTADYIQPGEIPTISSQPEDTSVCPGCTAILSVISDGALFQWQLFDGVNWNDLVDAGIYSGANTNELTITNATQNEHNNLYRVVVKKPNFICSATTSSNALLILQVKTVITNRRITYRVKKNL